MLLYAFLRRNQTVYIMFTLFVIKQNKTAQAWLSARIWLMSSCVVFTSISKLQICFVNEYTDKSIIIIRLEINTGARWSATPVLIVGMGVGFYISSKTKCRNLPSSVLFSSCLMCCFIICISFMYISMYVCM